MPASKPIAWITGAAGLIGSHIVQCAPRYAPQFHAVGLTRQDAELTDLRAVDALFAAQKPSLIIHCAALSTSTTCQSQPGLARRVNVEATAHLAELAGEIPFIFFSSDLVFDGAKGNYAETDTPHPLSIYGGTKLEAENIVLRNPKHTVVRTSLNGGTAPRSHNAFNEELRKTWLAGKAARLFRDEFRNPIAASVTARAVWELVQRNGTGLYHLAGGERLSRLEIGRLLAARHPEANPQIIETSLREYTGAPRPPDCSMNMGKIQKLLSFTLPGLTRWLEENPRVDF
jgi:dTDP-4-dehydrorhamnose reductase